MTDSLVPHPDTQIHSVDCACTACFAKCDDDARSGARIPLNREWWKTQTVYSVDIPARVTRLLLAQSKCVACNGTGLLVEQRASKVYACGFSTHAVMCSACMGSGRRMPVSAAKDFKTVASGGSL